jgi:phosphatidylglycerophosphate synthase
MEEDFLKNDGRKTSSEISNPLDNFLLENIIQPLNPKLKMLNVSPNFLTFLSFLNGVIGAFLVYNSKFLLSTIFLFFALFFDHFDGNYARKYKKVTKIGDYLDHSTDIIQIILLYVGVICNSKLEVKDKKIFIIVVSIFLFLSIVDLGCDEKIYVKNESETLSFSKYLCIGNVYSTKNIIKYFSISTAYMVIIIFLVYFEYKYK